MTCHDEAGESGLPSAVDLPRIALIGAPNAGKTTIFNRLTGLRAKTANYPGVTVTKRTGRCHLDQRPVLIDDLPGTYSLKPMSPDEQVVADALSGKLADEPAPDAVIVVADATTLARSLILISQALALQLPTCVVITMVDELAARGGSVDTSHLQRILGVPVLAVVGTRGVGIYALVDLLRSPLSWPKPVIAPPSDPVRQAAWIDGVLADVLFIPAAGHKWTQRVDRILLHPISGVLVFVLVMITFFQVIFTLAAPLQELLETAFSWMGSQAAEWIAWPVLASLVSDGIIAGVGTVLTFLPQILLLFLMISFLENIGYMSRAAFVMDRAMSAIGLEGRCFVALLSSYACAVPGIMATRTIPNSKDRIATIVVAPLMTCSARLPVYTLLIATFIPNSHLWGPLYLQGFVLLGLYLLGTVTALIVAAIFKRTALRADALPFFMEMPPYRVPGVRLVFTQCWDAVRYFLRKAGTIILATSIALWVLLHVPTVTPPENYPSQDVASYQLEHSIAGTIGRAVEPVFAPLGFNWQVNVAVIASLSAREVFVSTLGQIASAEDPDSEASVGERLQQQTNAEGDPLYPPGTVAAILVFFVFALACMSTVAVMRRETNSWRWPAIAFGYMFALAWLGGVTANVVVSAWTST